MSTMLYPLKFKPICKEKIWGGRKIETVLGRDTENMECCGESWEVSGMVDDESEIVNGFLAENNLNELLEIYMTDFVGEKNYEKYGLGFPLLIKYIDAQENLSVQVHPDDELAKSKYGQNGKTEMWHVIEAEAGAGLYIGFNQKVTKEQYVKAVDNGTLAELLQFYPVQAGDTFMIPAGTVHAIGKGVLLAEIQQSSDITFRIFDWNRVDEEGNSRELHMEEALEAIHFEENVGNFKIEYQPNLNHTVKLVRSQYFNTSLLNFDKPLSKTFVEVDSFIIYMCLEGHICLVYNKDDREYMEKGDVVLIPAEMEEVKLIPERTSTLLEIYC